jgi:hypothetical protein
MKAASFQSPELQRTGRVEPTRRPRSTPATVEAAEHRLPVEGDAALNQQYQRLASALRFLDVDEELQVAGVADRAATDNATLRAVAEQAKRLDETRSETPTAGLLNQLHVDWRTVERTVAADRSRFDVETSLDDWLAAARSDVMKRWVEPTDEPNAAHYKKTLGTSVLSFTERVEQQTLNEIDCLPLAVTNGARKVADVMTGAVQSRNLAAVFTNRWREYIVTAHSKGISGDVALLIQAVLRLAYVGVNDDLAYYAERVGFLNTQKRLLRDYLGELREFVAEQTTAAAKVGIDPTMTDYIPGQYARDIDKGTFYDEAQARDYHRDALRKTRDWVEKDTEARRKTFYVKESEAEHWAFLNLDKEIPPKGMYKREAVEEYLSTVEEKLQSIGDDAQLANVDLQNTLQKQQQTLQTISNTPKLLHDTALAIIRKLGQ